MKDLKGTLERMDAEITFNRQEIARRQVDIARLEDARRVLLGIAEADQAVVEARRGAEAGLLSGGQTITVRKLGAAEANGHPALELITSGPRKGLPRLKRRRADAGQKHAKPHSNRRGERDELRKRILETVVPGEAPISPKAIGNYLGLSTKEDARKPLWNALYQMRIEGSLSRNDEGQYYRPAVT